MSTCNGPSKVSWNCVNFVNRIRQMEWRESLIKKNTVWCYWLLASSGNETKNVRIQIDSKKKTLTEANLSMLLISSFWRTDFWWLADYNFHAYILWHISFVHRQHASVIRSRTKQLTFRQPDSIVLNQNHSIPKTNNFLLFQPFEHWVLWITCLSS